MKNSGDLNRNMGVAILVWLVLLLVPIGLVIAFHLTNANVEGAAELKDIFGYLSLAAGIFGLLLLLDYNKVFDFRRTKAGLKDKAGFVLAVVSVLAGVLNLFN